MGLAEKFMHKVAEDVAQVFSIFSKKLFAIWIKSLCGGDGAKKMRFHNLLSIKNILKWIKRRK